MKSRIERRVRLVLAVGLLAGGFTIHADSSSTDTNSAVASSPAVQAKEKELADAWNEQKALDSEKLKLGAALQKTSDEAAEAASHLTFSGKISGTAIVLAPDGKKVPIASMDVGLYTKSQVQQWIDGINNLTPRERDSLKVLCDYESAQTHDIPRPYKWNPNLPDVLALKKFIWSGVDRYSNVLAWVSAPPSLDTKTDANGNFTLAAPTNGGDYYVVAAKQQQIGDDSVSLLWIVKADSTAVPFVLDDKNRAPQDIVFP